LANLKSSKKRILITEKRRVVNTAKKSATKTAVKKAVAAIASKDAAKIAVALKGAESALARAAKRIMPKKRASRKISRLVKSAAKAK